MVLFLQVTMPTEGTNPYAWFLVIALGALGVLAVRYDNGQNRRAERCEKREDLVLEDNRSQAATIKDLSATVVRVAGLAEDSFALSTATSQKIDDIQRLLERAPGTTRQRS